MMKHLQANFSKRLLFFLIIFFLGLVSASLTHAETETYNLDTVWSYDSVTLNSACGLVVDSDGYVYVADSNNNRILKLSSTGDYEGTIGNDLSGPSDVAVDSNDIVYIADSNNNRIVKYNSDGTYAGTLETSGTTGQLYHPCGVAVDSLGNVYVADSWNDRIVIFKSDGSINTLGTHGSGDYQFIAPSGIAIDSEDNVYVADLDNHRIQKYNSKEEYQGTIGLGSSSDYIFNYPTDVAVDSSGNVYIVDSRNYRFVKYNNEGTYVTEWGTWGIEDDHFYHPEHIAVDSHSGKVYATDVNALKNIPTIKVFAKQKIPLTVTGIDPAMGSDRTEVYITGIGFTGATNVYFGEAPATSYHINSDEMITAIPPKGSGTVDVRVERNGDMSEISPNAQFTYTTVPIIDQLSPTSGPATGGNTVTIYGSGFDTSTSVIFGDSQIYNYNVENDGQITLTAPPGSGNAGVTVTGYGGWSNSVQYTYIVPAPTITSLSPTSGPAAGGNTVTIDGTGFTGDVSVKFGEFQATGLVVNSDTQITVTSPPGSGTVDVTVTASGGMSTPVQYTYLPVPTVTSLNPSSGPTGTIVTISGKDFTDVTGVKFGIVAASVLKVNSNTQITVTAPSGSGTVDVTVITPGGTSATSKKDKYTYKKK